MYAFGALGSMCTKDFMVGPFPIIWPVMGVDFFPSAISPYRPNWRCWNVAISRAVGMLPVFKSIISIPSGVSIIASARPLTWTPFMVMLSGTSEWISVSMPLKKDTRSSMAQWLVIFCPNTMAIRGRNVAFRYGVISFIDDHVLAVIFSSIWCMSMPNTWCSDSGSFGYTFKPYCT